MVWNSLEHNCDLNLIVFLTFTGMCNHFTTFICHLDTYELCVWIFAWSSKQIFKCGGMNGMFRIATLQTVISQLELDSLSLIIWLFCTVRIFSEGNTSQKKTFVIVFLTIQRNITSILLENETMVWTKSRKKTAII